MAKQIEKTIPELTEMALEICELIVEKGLHIDPKKTGVADTEVRHVFQHQFDQDDIDRLSQSESQLAVHASSLLNLWLNHEKPHTSSSELRAKMIGIVKNMRNLGWNTSAKMMGEEGALPTGDISMRGGLGLMALRP